MTKTKIAEMIFERFRHDVEHAVPDSEVLQPEYLDSLNHGVVVILGRMVRDAVVAARERQQSMDALPVDEQLRIQRWVALGDQMGV